MSGKYKNLMGNTLIFAISNFAQRGIGFLLMPLYTSILSKEGFGTFDILNNTIYFLIPVLTLSMSDAIMRFSIDSKENRSQLFSTGITVVIGSCLFLVACIPILNMVEFMNGYVIVFVILYITSALRTYISQFIRGVGQVMLFAIDGIFTTLVLVLLNILLLVVYRLGPLGYLISLLVANFASILLLCVFGKVWKYIDIKGINKKYFKDMFKYSCPLIPNTISWWGINFLNRYIVIIVCGEAINGLFASANRIPGMLMVLSTIFMQAWQLSAVKEYNKEDTGKFYTNILKGYSSLIFIVCSLLLATLTTYSKFLFLGDFKTAWVFVPFLLLGMAFNCLVGFYGAVYISAKKTTMNLMSSVIGAVATIIIYITLVPLVAKIKPEYGAIMAGFGVMIGFGVMLLIRIIDTKKYVNINLNMVTTLLNILLIFLQCIVLSFEINGYNYIAVALFIAVIILNLPNAKQLIYKLAKSRTKTT